MNGHPSFPARLHLLICVLLLLRMPLPSQGQTAAASSVTAALSHFDRAAMTRADAAIEQAIAAGNCPGAVLLVGRDDVILYEKAYGNRALQPARAPMTLDTVFDLASLTKPLATATSIMLLAERGKLKLDDPVANFLPAFAARGKEKITIADLLLHVGGLIPDDDMGDYCNGPAAAIENICDLPLTYPVRGRFAYSDVGYIVLGEVVRVADGRALDTFDREEIFQPLQMSDTGFLPGEALRARCAPTERRGARWVAGEVHDPRAFALGGSAGHAGVFGTAHDLARFCRMLIGRGTVDGRRILQQSTAQQMIEPRAVGADGAVLRAYGFDVDSPYSGVCGDRFQRGETFGHTGFTGTAFWIDPANRSYFILLANSVHPDGKGNVKKLRHDVATIVGEALLGPGLTTGPVLSTASPHGVLCGIDVLKRDDYASLAGRKVGLVTNQTGRDQDGNRTIDLLANAKNFHLVRLFSPEHGIDGILDEKVDNSTDAKTGLKILSLYGKSQKPTPAMLEGIDTLVFDMQDAGTRFYTYISTMGLCMQTAAECKIRFVVLDRPNPNTGLVCDGPLADAKHLGFTAFAPLPLVHGMTLGEVARFYNAELKINCDLQVVPMQGWRRRMWWDETGLMWINPSPNLRNPTAALLYPAVGLLEASNVSVGRGTDQPFEQFGAPWLDARRLAQVLNAAGIAGLRFVPITFEPKSSKFAGEKCQGVHLQITDRNAFQPAPTGVAIAWWIRKEFGEKFDWEKVGKMLQNTQVMGSVERSMQPMALPTYWEADVAAFRTARGKYLLYP